MLNDLCGAVTHRCVQGACRCLQPGHAPVVKAAAVSLLLYVASAHANINQNALLDYAMLRADGGGELPSGTAASAAVELDPLAVLERFDASPTADCDRKQSEDHVPTAASDASPCLFRSLVSLLPDRAARRAASQDALVLLALLLSYHRFDARNPFVACMHTLHTGNAVDEALSVDTHSPVSSVDVACVRGMVQSLAALGACCTRQLLASAAAAQGPTGAAALALNAAGAAGTAAGAVVKGLTSTVFAAVSFVGSSLWGSSAPRPRPVTGARASAAAATTDGAHAQTSAADGAARNPEATSRAPLVIVQAESPLRLPVGSSVGVALIMFYEAFCSHPRGLAAAAATHRWRGHAGAAPQPVSLPEMLRQLLSVTSFALQSASAGQCLAQLGLLVLRAMVDCRDTNLLMGLGHAAPAGTEHSHSSREPTSVSVSARSGQHEVPGNPVLAVLHSHGLDRLSTSFPLFRRGHAGALSSVMSDKERPPVAAVYRMVCHSIAVNAGQQVHVAVVASALGVLRRLLFYRTHVVLTSPPRASLSRIAESGQTDEGTSRGVGASASRTPARGSRSKGWVDPRVVDARHDIEWEYVVRVLLTLAQRLSSRLVHENGTASKPCSVVELELNFEVRLVAVRLGALRMCAPFSLRTPRLQLAIVLDSVLYALRDPSRKFLFYECLRRGEMLTAWRARVMLRASSVPPGHKTPSTAAQPAGLELSCGLPPRAALAFKNLRDVIDCMSQAMTSSTLSLTTAQMRVHNAQPWLVMTPAHRHADALGVGGAHGDSADARRERCMFQSVVRDIVFGARWRLGIRR